MERSSASPDRRIAVPRPPISADGISGTQSAGAAGVAIASEANHAWLAGKGAIPIAYDPNLETFHIDAFIDLQGPHRLDLAIEIGIPPARINTIISFA